MKPNFKVVEFDHFRTSAGLPSFVLSASEWIERIALPAIGAGLGGLKWDEVKDVLNRVSADYPTIELYVVEAYQSASPIS